MRDLTLGCSRTTRRRDAGDDADRPVPARHAWAIGPRGPEYRRQGDDVRWYCYDGLGSVLAEVTPTGVMTASRTYDVYGLARSSNGTSTSKHKFVGSLGHTSEDDTGLVYMRARWVDPAVGRFVSEDPANHGANWFSYCGANPVNARDRNGKWAEGVELLVDLLFEVGFGLGAAWLEHLGEKIGMSPRMMACLRFELHAMEAAGALALAVACFVSAGTLGFFAFFGALFLCAVAATAMVYYCVMAAEDAWTVGTGEEPRII